MKIVLRISFWVNVLFGTVFFYLLTEHHWTASLLFGLIMAVFSELITPLQNATIRSILRKISPKEEKDQPPTQS